MSAVAAVRIPLARPKPGGNPGYYIRRLEERVAALEAENAALRASTKSRQVRGEKIAVERPTETWALAHATFHRLGIFDEGTAPYVEARGAYMLARWGTTNERAIRRAHEAALTVTIGSVP